MPLEARTILVTGSSRGLGLEFVRQILNLKKPPDVLLACCRSPQTATELKAIAIANPTVKIVKLDSESDEDIVTALQESTTFLGDRGLNLLICNAGIGDMSTSGLEYQTREKLQRYFNVNVSGPLILIQKFLPLIQQAASQNMNSDLSFSRAGVVLVSSILGSQAVTAREGALFLYDYRCSKTAVNMSAILLARELEDSGVLVTALYPGWVRTNIGTDSAPLSKEDSINDCLTFLGRAGDDCHGKFLSYQGEILPY